MKTGLLNWRKVLLGAQMLCLGAVAAIFLVTPLVSFAACGGGGGNKNAVKVQKGITILAVTNKVAKTVTGATVLNSANAGAPGGVVVPLTNFKISDLKNGQWITASFKGVTFQGTVFNVKVVNGNQKVAEIWVADPTPNTQGVNAGLVLKNVSLAGIPA